MSRLGHSQLVHGRVLEVEEIDARLAELDTDGINEVAARWLSSPRTVAAVGPFDDEAALG
jgi:predicted Zn-dependent peptidase